VRSATDRTLASASLAQAAGTLTVHLLPLLVHLVATGGRLTAFEAGSYATAFSVGQLAATLLLPSLAASLPPGRVVMAAGLLLCASLIAAGWIAVPPHGLWAMAGLASGALICASAMTAARDPRPMLAFSMRLSMSLLVGGLGTLVLGLLLRSGDAQIGHRGPFWALAGVIGVLLLAMFVFAGPVSGGVAGRKRPAVDPVSRDALLGLLLLGALFAGQIGTIVLLLRQVVESGAVLVEVVLVMAACKCVAAAFVFFAARRGVGTAYVRTTGLLLALTAWGMSLATDVASLTVALLMWELCITRLSAVMQGTLARLSPAATGAWSSALLLGGAAAGPMLHGAALDHGLGALFVAFAMATAVAAGLWSSTRGAVPETR